MIAPGSAGITTARNLVVPLMATGPDLIGMIAAVDHAVRILVTPDRRAGRFGQPHHEITPVMTDHVLSVVRMTAQNSIGLLKVTALGLVGIMTALSLIGPPTVIVREVVAGTTTAQNSTGLLRAIGLGLTGMTGPIGLPVPDPVAINQPVHHASTGKIVRTSVTGIRIFRVLQMTGAGVMIALAATVQSGRAARMAIAHA
ncbi:hypothetical protein GCM10028818_13330 [Spirosoma horti]